MHSNFVAIPIIALFVGFIIYRNTTWRTVKLAKLLRLPVVLALFGTYSVFATAESLGNRWVPSDVDFSVLGSEVVLAVIVGWAMGKLSQFRTLDGVVSSRLSRAGVAVFVSFIVIRVVAAVVAGQYGGTSAIMSSSVLLIIAVIKLVQALVIRQAVAEHSAIPVHTVVDPADPVLAVPSLR